VFTNRAGSNRVGVPPGFWVRTRERYNAAVLEEQGGARRVFTVRSQSPSAPLPRASRDYRAWARRNFAGFREVSYTENQTYAGHRPAIVFEYLADRDGRRVHVSHINVKGRTWGYNVIGPSLPAVLAAAQAGDEQAFAVLWRDLQPAVLRYLRVAVPTAAEDLAADTWMSLIRSLGRFRGDERGSGHGCSPPPGIGRSTGTDERPAGRPNPYRLSCWPIVPPRTTRPPRSWRPSPPGRPMRGDEGPPNRNVERFSLVELAAAYEAMELVADPSVTLFVYTASRLEIGAHECRSRQYLLATGSTRRRRTVASTPWSVAPDVDALGRP
jgi:hypothetical protein